MKLTIPNNLSEITVEKYLKALDCLVEENTQVRDIRLISVWCDIEPNKVVKLPVNEFKEIVEIIIKTLNQKPNLSHIIKVNGKDYGFEPELEAMGSDAYIDLSTYFDKDYLRAMAVLYRPIQMRMGRIYSISEYKGTENYKDFLQCKASEIVGSRLFFYRLTNDLLKTIPKFLAENLTAEQITKMEASGVGIQQFTKLVEEIDLDLTKL